ncbi:MAG: nucleotide exchange factor GrpE [Chloroflexi bacterium]|nr:nucleotide exchange factor GrpE [Chloroflexota bacterium]
MPRRTRAEERAAEIDVSPTKLLADIEGLTAEREEARAQAAEYLAGLQRERAEFVNFRRRTEQDGAAAASRAADSLRLRILDALDDFDRAIEARPSTLADDPWAEGIAAIDRKLRALLEWDGVRPMEPSIGDRFDPRLHQALSHVAGSGRPADEIVGEFARGYWVADRVLRPALVAVSDGADGHASTGSAGDAEPSNHPNHPNHADTATDQE